MESKQYIALAKKTESVPTELKINQLTLHASLRLAIAAGNIMDKVKRRLFYGKPLEHANLVDDLQDVVNLGIYINSTLMNIPEGTDLETTEANVPMPQEAVDEIPMPDNKKVNLTNVNIRLLHAAIGGFTENGEKLEALLAQYEGKPLDMTNFAEENGDTQWYNAIEIDELQALAVKLGLNPAEFTEAAIRVKNLTKLQGNTKLKGRYSQGDFDAVEALNRDLANERAILETNHLTSTPANVAHLNASIGSLRSGDTITVVTDESGNFKAA